MKKDFFIALGSVLVVVLISAVFYFMNMPKDSSSGRVNPVKQAQEDRKIFEASVKDFSFSFDDLKNIGPEDFVEKISDIYDGMAGLYINETSQFSLNLPMGYNVDALLDDSGYTFVPEKNQDVVMGVYLAQTPDQNLKEYIDGFFFELGNVDIRAQEAFPFGTFADGMAYWVTYNNKVGLYLFSSPVKGKYYTAFLEGSPEKVARYKYILAYTLETFIPEIVEKEDAAQKK